MVLKKPIIATGFVERLTIISASKSEITNIVKLLINKKVKLMRSILFRGKCLETGAWRYGSLCLCDEGKTAYISNIKPKAKDSWAFTYEVDPNTIGQFTGKQDSDDRNIFEGDILHHEDYLSGEVLFSNEISSFFACFDSTKDHNSDWSMNLQCNRDLKIIGNVYDNPNIIKKDSV